MAPWRPSLAPLALALLALAPPAPARAALPTAPHVDARLSRAVLVFAEGLDWARAPPDLVARFNRAGTLERAPGLDAAGVASRVSTGCDLAASGAVSSLTRALDAPATGRLHLLADSFAHEGKLVDVVTARCLDDGTTSPFLARWGDRYDLDAVAALVARAAVRRAAGGWSDSLRRRLERAGPAVAARFAFTAPAGSPFAATCAYGEEAALEPRAAAALRELEAAPGEGYLLVVVQSALTRGAGDPARLNASLARLGAFVDEATAALGNRTRPDWAVLAFGSLDARSPPGAGASLLVAAPRGSHLLSARTDLGTYGALGRALAPGLGCGGGAAGAVARHSRTGHHPPRAAYADDGWEAALVALVVLTLAVAAFCACFPLEGRNEIWRHHAEKGINRHWSDCAFPLGHPDCKTPLRP